MNQVKNKPNISQEVFIIGLFIVVILLLIAFFYYNSTKDYKVLVDETQALFNNYEMKIPSEMIPPPNGLKMSFILWLYIDNISENSQWFSNFTGDKIIMDKNNGPTIVYLPYSNSIKVLVKIKDIRQPLELSERERSNTHRNVPSHLEFKERVQEIEVNDIKFQSWTQLAVVIDNRYLDVYLNAVLVKSVLLDNVPIFNHGEITIGKSKHNPNLFLGKLEYKPDVVSLAELNAMNIRDKNSLKIDGSMRKKINLDAMFIRKDEYATEIINDEIENMNRSDPI